jgi:hypothetical protein
MRTNNLISIFDSIPPAKPSTIATPLFSAIPIPSYEQHRVAKDAYGFPAILISVADPSLNVNPLSVALEHLTVQYDITCRISNPDADTEEGRFTIVRCTSTDRMLHAYFLRIIVAVLGGLGNMPTRLEVSQAVSKLIELFRAMSEAPRKSVRGLWAELFLIAQAHNPAVLVSAWHTMPEDKYDFAAGSQRIEIKSVSSRVRQHYFSLEQLHPPAATTVLIASLFVERAGAGTSLGELVDETRSCVSGNTDLAFHLDKTVALVLGESWRSAMEERFDRELAQESLAFFEAESIPTVNPDIPLGVTEVRFKADLTGQPNADLKRLRVAQGLFRAALRR